MFVLSSLPLSPSGQLAYLELPVCEMIGILFAGIAPLVQKMPAQHAGVPTVGAKARRVCVRYKGLVMEPR